MYGHLISRINPFLTIQLYSIKALNEIFISSFFINPFIIEEKITNLTKFLLF